MSGCRTHNPAVPGSSPESRSDNLIAGFVLSHPEFRSSATLVNSQLVASCKLGFLILLYI